MREIDEKSILKIFKQQQQYQPQRQKKGEKQQKEDLPQEQAEQLQKIMTVTLHHQ